MDHRDRAIIMDWFRSHHGAPTDAKYLMLARRCNVQPHEVAYVWWALMDYASQNTPRGSIQGFDAEALACFSGLDEPKIKAIVGVCRDKGMIDQADMLSAWSKRQPKKEDDSSQRVRAFRERKRAETTGNDDVTLCNGRTEQNRAEQNRPPQPPEGDSVEQEFDRFWAAYPKRAGGDPKRDALICFRARRKEGHTLDEILRGTLRYAKFCEATGKLRTETVAMAKTFLGPSKRFLEGFELPVAKPGFAAPEVPRQHRAFPS